MSNENMELEKLSQILNETTRIFRTGEEIKERMVGNLKIIELWGMPHLDEAPQDLEKVNVHFMTVGVDKEKASAKKGELVAFLDKYPDPERLAKGPSYIEVAFILGSQELALRLFGLGETLGLWKVITPEILGITGEQADQLAGQGFVLIDGYKRRNFFEP